MSAQSSDWQDWYRLSFNYGLSFAQKLALLKRLSLPENIFAAAPRELAEIVGESAVSSMQEHGGEVEEGLVASALWLGKGADHHIICLDDARFPKSLLDLADPPLLLFAHGALSSLQSPSLAVVGSRSPSPQGIENAKAFAKAIGQAGYAVVSGLALGIDTAAHEGALAAGAPTVAVVGTGIDRVYPARNHALARRIAAQGLIVSELALGSPPLPQHFPRRNRLIAALSKGVLVVEAAKQSGSLITAGLALEMGREVFAIPGSIHSAVSKGCHQLLRQGAKLVESGQDILEELQPFGGGGALPNKPPNEPCMAERLNAVPQAENDLSDPVLLAMGFEPVQFVDIIERCKLPSQRVQTRLLELELRGQISRLDDGRLLQIVEAT
jgi:DNA processing protein